MTQGTVTVPTQAPSRHAGQDPASVSPASETLLTQGLRSQVEDGLWLARLRFKKAET